MDWQKEFDEKFVDEDGFIGKYVDEDEGYNRTGPAVKEYIRELLARERKALIEEIEKAVGSDVARAALAKIKR
jgi:hypothetical protein